MVRFVERSVGQTVNAMSIVRFRWRDVSGSTAIGYIGTNEVHTRTQEGSVRLRRARCARPARYLRRALNSQQSACARHGWLRMRGCVREKDGVG